MLSGCEGGLRSQGLHWRDVSRRVSADRQEDGEFRTAVGANHPAGVLVDYLTVRDLPVPAVTLSRDAPGFENHTIE